MLRRLIGYARVNARGELNLEHQISQLQNAGVEQVLTDVQMGTSSDRVGLNRLLEWVQTGQVEEIVVTRIDRLSRSINQFQQLYDLCQSKGVVIRSLDGVLPLVQTAGTVIGTDSAASE